MNLDRLKRVLNSTLDESSSVFQNAVEKTKNYSYEDRQIWQNHELAQPVEEALSIEEEFKDGAGFLVRQENGYTGFQRRFVSIKLVQYARETGTEATISWLKKVLSTERADGLCISVLWGIQTPSRIKFSEDIEMLPVTELPASTFKARLLRPRTFEPAVGFSPHVISDSPQAALVSTVTIEPFLWDLRRGEPPKQTDGLAIRERHEDVRLALTLVSSTTPLEAMYWFQFIDPDLEAASFFRGSSTKHPEVIPWSYDAKQPLDCGAARAVVDGFVSLGMDLKQRVKVALERLNLAMRRLKPADQAVELTIALESLLVDGPGENTHKVGLRSALILGGSDQERVWNRAVVGAIYTMRSALLHSGHVSKMIKVKGKRIKAEDLVEHGLSVCRSVVQAVIKRQSLPDWYKFELGLDG